MECKEAWLWRKKLVWICIWEERRTQKAREACSICKGEKGGPKTLGKPVEREEAQQMAMGATS